MIYIEQCNLRKEDYNTLYYLFLNLICCIMASTREKLLDTTSKFVETFGSFDVETILSVRSPTCLYHMCFPSFNKNTLNNEETRASFPQWISAVIRFDFSILEPSHTLIDEAGKRVMVRTKASAETVVGGYENEYVFVLRMTEDCSLVDEIWEFYDTIRLQDLQRRLVTHKVSIGGNAPFSTGVEQTSKEVKA